MKAVCDGISLADAVNKVIKAVGTRTTNPILECIRIKAEGTALEFLATDGEISIEKKINSDVLIEGAVLVTGRYFADFVKTLTNQRMVEINSYGTKEQPNQIRMTFNQGMADFFTQSVEEFPDLQLFENSESFTIVKKDFKDLVNKVHFSVSSDDVRPVLKGVLIEVENRRLNAIALDGYRLAMASKPLEKNTTQTSFIVSARVLNEISKLLEDNEDFLTVYIQKNHILIDLDHTKVTARLMTGDFINYKQIIPEKYNSFVTVNRKDFEVVLNRANLVAGADRNNMVKLIIGGNEMKIISSSEISSSSESLDVAVNGSNLTIAFNSRYLVDVARAIDDEFINICLNNSFSPCVILPTDKQREDYLYLILPISLKG